MRRGLTALGLFALLLAAGCSSPGQGEVSGKVTYKSKPLPGGLVTFRPADGKHNAVTVELDTEGNYPAVTLPAGEVAVIIDNRDLAPQPDLSGPSLSGIPLSAEAKKVLKEAPPAPRAGGGGRKSPRYVLIPERYHAAETSGLKFKVERGAQKKDFELTD